MENNRNITISLETAKEWYKEDNEVLKRLALQAFTESELQKSAICVKSWKEFCEQNPKVNCEYYINTGSKINSCIGSFRDIEGDKNLLATKKDAEAVLAFIQLKRLRDQWWKALDWKPDYTNYNCKYAIKINENKIVIDKDFSYQRFLAFSTKEIAEDFLKCFRDLIEQAKELI